MDIIRGQDKQAVCTSTSPIGCFEGAASCEPLNNVVEQAIGCTCFVGTMLACPPSCTLASLRPTIVYTNTRVQQRVRNVRSGAFFSQSPHRDPPLINICVDENKTATSMRITGGPSCGDRLAKDVPRQHAAERV